MGDLVSSTDAKNETDGVDGSYSVAPPDSENKIVTTEEELQGYYIVRGIVCEVLGFERITYRDTQSYFGILCDDNNRRPICRLHFNGRQKYIGLFNVAGDKNKEERIPIDSLNEIYKLTGRLKATAEWYASTLKAV
jgi:hypothetical protein